MNIVRVGTLIEYNLPGIVCSMATFSAQLASTSCARFGANHFKKLGAVSRMTGDEAKGELLKLVVRGCNERRHEIDCTASNHTVLF